jgi:ribosomal protein S13
MVKIANQTLRNYIETMDENSKKEFFQIVSEDNKNLENRFEELKNSAISKLQNILENESESDVKTKINETIDKLKEEKFDQLNFLKLKNLEGSL